MPSLRWVLDDKDIEGVMGREIYSIAGEDMGRIVDILVDHKGNLRAAIIDFGGFLGVGSRKIAVDWHAIQFGQDRALLSLTSRSGSRGRRNIRMGNRLSF